MDAYNISDFEAFADAAEEFHPHVKFFATFSPKVSNNDYYVKFDQTHLKHHNKTGWNINECLKHFLIIRGIIGHIELT